MPAAKPPFRSTDPAVTAAGRKAFAIGNSRSIGPQAGPDPVTKALEAPASALAWIVDPHTWLRIMEGIGGIILLVIGLKTLSGNTTTPMDVVKRVANKTAAGHAARMGYT